MSTNNYVEPDLNLGALAPDSQRGKIVNHKLKEGDNIFRILPPFGANHNGVLMAEWYLHWGFTDSKAKAKPIVCTKRYENYCPICEEANKAFTEKEEFIREYKSADGKVNYKSLPEEIRIKYSELNEKFNQLRAQRNYYYNAVDDSGKVGILKLAKTAKDKLNAKILDAYTRLSFNPTSLENGCFIKIIKTKTGNNTWDVSYDVELVKRAVKEPDGTIVEKYDVGSVSDWIKNNFSKVAIDTHNMYPIRTSAEIIKIMDGDTSIFDKEGEVKQQARNGATAKGTTSAEAPKPETAPMIAPAVINQAPAITPAVINQQAPAPLSDMSADERMKLNELKNTLGITNE